MGTSDLHLGRVVLRGGAASVQRARADLPAALARSRWPEAGAEAILVVRRVDVHGTLAELPARAAAATARLARDAADPWSPAADRAGAVRFRDGRDYRACLLRDLLAGTATGRWLWRHRGPLPGPRPAAVIAALLAEEALALPALLGHPGLQPALPGLWRVLDAPAAHALLQAIGDATGWSGAIAAALDPPPDNPVALAGPAQAAEAGNRGHAAQPASGAAHPGAGANDPSPPPAGPRRPLPAPAPGLPLHGMDLPGRGAVAGLPPQDPRVVLQAVLAVWARAPATLGAAGGAAALRRAAQALAGDPPHRVHSPTGPAPSPTPIMSAQTGKPDPPHSGEPAPTPPARPVAPAPPSPPPRPPAGDMTHAPASLAGPGFETRSGGLFFLINVLNLPALRAWRAALAEPQAGWRELARLAARIGVPVDPPLADFLARACGLDPDADPAAALAALGPGHDAAAVDAAARRFHGDAALAAVRAARQARVTADASRVDVRLPPTAVDLDIRRAGLDIDPGWLPWLGRIVRFHYEREGSTP